ncbi:MAG: hypothetical protein IJK46_05955 [Prevotella sp.]|nr:hypothetical protein [Prevotella sp.]
MNGIDKLFRAKLEEWLSKKKHTEAELADGAMMVLQCNRNHAMYNTIMRRPARYEEKISYELRKHLRYLKDDMNLDEVKDLERKVLPVIGKAITDTEETADKAAAALGEIPEDSFLPAPALSSEEPYKQTDTIVARGKRTDHDTLPETIRAIWDKNAERYKKIKQAHETCKTLTAACDRYEYTKAIAELWADYKKDFDTYDHYVLVPVNEEAGTQTPDTEEVQLSAEDVKAINAARPYISKNLPKLTALVAAAKQEGFTEAQAQELESWRDRIQQRVDVLIRTKQVITDELKAQLIEAGITFEKTDSDEQGQEHSDDTPATE